MLNSALDLPDLNQSGYLEIYDIFQRAALLKLSQNGKRLMVCTSSIFCMIAESKIRGFNIYDCAWP